MSRFFARTAIILAAAGAAALPAYAAKAPALPTAAAPQMAAIIYDANRLPAPVQQMRAQILAAAKSGNIEQLRPLFGHGSAATQILPAGAQQDPIAWLKTSSADGRGREVLADLIQILQSGAVKQSENGQDIYVWPYFAAISPQTLTPPQIVEAYQIMSVDDLDTIREIGHYIYFRTGISADGAWRFFRTGDDAAKAAGSADATDPALPRRSELPSPYDPDSLPDN